MQNEKFSKIEMSFFDKLIMWAFDHAHMIKYIGIVCTMLIAGSMVYALAYKNGVVNGYISGMKMSEYIVHDTIMDMNIARRNSGWNEICPDEYKINSVPEAKGGRTDRIVEYCLVEAMSRIEKERKK